jgi:hypothetical protein
MLPTALFPHYAAAAAAAQLADAVARLARLGGQRPTAYERGNENEISNFETWHAQAEMKKTIKALFIQI